jgi:hypothetical protein
MSLVADYWAGQGSGPARTATVDKLHKLIGTHLRIDGQVEKVCVSSTTTHAARVRAG